MGTNYYMIYNECNCCDRFDSFHIGKKSFGWQFSFQCIQPEMPYTSPDGCLTVSNPKDVMAYSWSDWKEMLKSEEISIHDEYNRSVPYLELKKIVEDSMKDKTNKNHTVECGKSYYGEAPYLDSEGYSFVFNEFE